MKEKLKKNAFLYYWVTSIRMGFKIKYPVEGFLSKHKFVSIIPYYFKSLYHGFLNRAKFKNVETYFMFFGNQRSGHSLIASLIDAHPNIVLAHELNAYKLWIMGFKRFQVYYLILKNAAAYGKRGRGESGYNYIVPNAHQGKFTNILAIGDKDGRRDTRILKRFPNSFLPTVRSNKKVKMINVVRNPFDNITTICMRERKSEITKENIDNYFEMAKSVDSISALVNKEDFLLIYQEDLISSPKEFMKKICLFLAVEPVEDYLDKCVSIVYESPNKSRHKLVWSEEFKQYTQQCINEIPYLSKYNFEN